MEFSNVFGSWFNKDNINKLHYDFQHAQPYPHVIINNFLNDDIAKQISREFPNKQDSNWNVYYNPFEIKLANSDSKSWPPLIHFVMTTCLQHPSIVNVFEHISDIPNLQTDPFMHGAGIHCMPTGGKLDVHLDYSKHPITGKERRLNLIIYLTENWQKHYGGELQLWNESLSQCSSYCYPYFNYAILLRTSDISYHGIPNPVLCPPTLTRNSLAVYYVSDPRPDVQHRYKATYVNCNKDDENDYIKNLRRIRSIRRLETFDIQNWKPNWYVEL